VKKSYLYGLAGLVVVAGVTVAVVLSGKKSDGGANGQASATTGGFTAHLKNACDILTQSVAKDVLGADAIKGTGVGDTEANDVKVTTCNYTSAANQTSMELLVRAAESKTQADNNAAQFDGKVNVPGYGDKAYWDASMGEFNILEHGNWYILSNGTLRPADHTQADGQKFADAIKSSL
jgi:hypothetical protein